MQSTPLVEFCSKAKGYFDRFETDMLADGNYDDIMNDAEIKPYSDPALRSKNTVLRLAARMWAGGMLGWSAVCYCEIALFTVFKRENPDGTWVTRPVWDLRLANRLFKKAPWISMASPGSLGELELTPEVLGDRVPGSVQADVPDFFSFL